PPHASSYSLSLHDALPISCQATIGNEWVTLSTSRSAAVISSEGAKPVMATSSRAESSDGLALAAGCAPFSLCFGSGVALQRPQGDRKSTRLNSSHVKISYA